MSVQNKPRGRGKSEKKRVQILEAATSLFISQGITATSMDQLAEAAGVSKQTLYSHFGGKEDLFVAAIEQKCIHYALSEELFDDERPLREVLKDLASHLVELLLSEDAIKLHRLCISGVDQFPTICELFYEAGPRNITNIFRKYLDRQVAIGNMNIENCEFAAQQFLFMVKGEAHMEALLNLQEKIEVETTTKYLDSCVDMFLKSYGSKE